MGSVMVGQVRRLHGDMGMDFRLKEVRMVMLGTQRIGQRTAKWHEAHVYVMDLPYEQEESIARSAR